MRIWTRRSRFLGFEYFYAEKQSNIIRLGTSFLQKLSHDKDDAWDILERHCGCCRYIQSCRDRLHCVLTFVHQSDGRSWETSFSLRNFLYTLYAFIYFQRASEFFPREEGTRKSFSVADGLTKNRSVFFVFIAFWQIHKKKHWSRHNHHHHFRHQKRVVCCSP